MTNRKVSTIFGAIRQEGIAEGKIEGKIEGIAEGKIEGKIECLQESLKGLILKKFGNLPSAIAKKIDASNMEELQKAQFSIFEAKTPESLFDN